MIGYTPSAWVTKSSLMPHLEIKFPKCLLGNCLEKNRNISHAREGFHLVENNLCNPYLNYLHLVESHGFRRGRCTKN